MQQPNINLFIVGAPKCGTTSMYHYLKQHPEIYFPEEKEPNYYNTDLKRAKRFSKQEYFNLYSTLKNETIVGEATPLYLMSKDAPENIQQDHKDVKIIIMVRKPSDVVYSAYLQNLYNGCEIIENFEEAFNNQTKRKDGYKLPKVVTEPIERLEYDNFVHYKEDIPRWIEAFGKQNVLILLMDDLKNNQKNELDKVLNFLNLDSNNFDIEDKVFNPATKNKNNTLHRALKNPPSFISKISRLFLSDNLRSKIYQRLRKANETKLDKKKLAENFEQMLKERYLSQTEYIEQLLNRDLSHWK